MNVSSGYFQKALRSFKKDAGSEEGLQTLYRAFLYNPQNIAVRIMLRGKKKQVPGGNLLPHVD